MKTLIIIFFLLISEIATCQVIKMKVLWGDYEFYKIMPYLPEPEVPCEINVNNQIVDYTCDTNSGYISLIITKKKIFSDTLNIKIFAGFYSIRLINYLKTDTIQLPTIYNFNNIIIKDVFYKFKDIKYYKKQYENAIKEYNSDSTYYRIGKYKGFKHKNEESWPFHFSENGIWKCYSKNGELISEYNYKKSQLNGSYHIFPGKNRNEIIGQFKNGNMDGKWVFTNEDNIRYSLLFKDNVLIYDFKKDNH